MGVLPFEGNLQLVTVNGFRILPWIPRKKRRVTTRVLTHKLEDERTRPNMARVRLPCLAATTTTKKISILERRHGHVESIGLNDLAHGGGAFSNYGLSTSVGSPVRKTTSWVMCGIIRIARAGSWKYICEKETAQLGSSRPGRIMEEQNQRV